MSDGKTPRQYNSRWAAGPYAECIRHNGIWYSNIDLDWMRRRPKMRAVPAPGQSETRPFAGALVDWFRKRGRVATSIHRHQ